MTDEPEEMIYPGDPRHSCDICSGRDKMSAHIVECPPEPLSVALDKRGPLITSATRSGAMITIIGKPLAGHMIETHGQSNLDFRTGVHTTIHVTKEDGVEKRVVTETDILTGEVLKPNS